MERVSCGPQRAARTAGARCRAAGRAEAAPPGGPRWTARLPVSPGPPSWTRSKYKASYAVWKGKGTLTMLNWGSGPPPTRPSSERAVEGEGVAASPQVLACLPGLTSKGVTMQLCWSQVVAMQAPGTPRMVSLPVTLPTLGPLSLESSLGGPDTPLTGPEEGTPLNTTSAPGRPARPWRRQQGFPACRCSRSLLQDGL